MPQVPLLAFLPSPAENGFHVGPLFFRAYGICYVFAVLGAVVVTTRRWGDAAVLGAAAAVERVLPPQPPATGATSRRSG